MSQIEQLKSILQPPEPKINGHKAGEIELDPKQIWAQAVQASRTLKRRESRKANQNIYFDAGPVCIVTIADIHAGGEGVDYEGLERDLTLINETPGMYLMLVGDLLDNFIIGKLAQLMMMRKFKISEEWALVRYVAQLAAPKLLACVAGNHDKWTLALSGIDYFREVWAEHAPDVLYDTDDLQVIVNVRGASYAWRLRHKWRGYSQYNPTHAIEKASMFDKGQGFDVGVGAHTHAAGVSRFFNNGGKTGLAVLCGTYKYFDEYAKTGGFPKANDQQAQAIILDDDGHVLSANSLEAAAKYMRRMYG